MLRSFLCVLLVFASTLICAAQKRMIGEDIAKNAVTAIQTERANSPEGKAIPMDFHDMVRSQIDTVLVEWKGKGLTLRMEYENSEQVAQEVMRDTYKLYVDMGIRPLDKDLAESMARDYIQRLIRADVYSKHMPNEEEQAGIKKQIDYLRSELVSLVSSSLGDLAPVSEIEKTIDLSMRKYYEGMRSVTSPYGKKLLSDEEETAILKWWREEIRKLVARYLHERRKPESISSCPEEARAAVEAAWWRGAIIDPVIHAACHHLSMAIRSQWKSEIPEADPRLEQLNSAAAESIGK